MLLVKSSEIILKRRATRRMLEGRLLTALREALGPLACRGRIKREGGMFTVELEEEREIEAANRLRNVFGIHSIQIAMCVPSNIADISKECVKTAKAFRRGSSFALRVRRVGSHPFTSADVANIAGEKVRKKCRLKVNLDNPDNEIHVGIREKKTYISRGRIKGAGGLPVGSQGTFVCVLSPGDSLLAGWMVMKRGGALIILAAYKDEKGRRRLERGVKLLGGWHTGKKMRVSFLKTGKTGRKALVNAGNELAKRKRANGVVLPHNDIKTALLFPDVLFPLVGMGNDEVKMASKGIGLKFQS